MVPSRPQEAAGLPQVQVPVLGHPEEKTHSFLPLLMFLIHGIPVG